MKYLSISQANTHAQCPKKYEFMYIHKLPWKRNAKMIFGTAFGEAVQWYLKRTDVVWRDASTFIHAVVANIKDVDGENIENLNELDELTETGCEKLSQPEALHLVESMLDQIQRPVRCEVENQLKIDDVMLTSQGDIIDAKDNIWEFKCRWRTPQRTALDTQLIQYALVAGQGVIEDRMVHKRSVIMLKEVKTLIEDVMITADTQRFFLENYALPHAKQIMSMQTFPINPNGWWCSAEQCPFWANCIGTICKSEN